MATDIPHKQQFRIRELNTRSVLLFPTRAQIIRDIKDITLQPGPNQIIIDGLAPTVDEHSIKVEGTGAATISEVTVDLLPNHDIYEEIYPSDSEDDMSMDEDDESDAETEAMRTINAKIKTLNTALINEDEKTNSADERFKICDRFGKSIADNRPPPADLEKILIAYNEERKKIFSDHVASVGAAGYLREQITKAEKEKTKITKALVKATEKQEKEKAKLREKKLRQKAEIHKEKRRIKAERNSFWPKKVYRITINLEPSILTPGTSRRGSIDSEATVNLATSTFHEPTETKSGQVSLSLSYITYSASWAPRYDLSLNTVKCTGLLEYGAELTNTTSETWRDAKVILSTSQTSFSGLSETIPLLNPWHVRLMKGVGTGALFSQDEIQAKKKEWSDTTDQSQKQRHELFGVDNRAQAAYDLEQLRKKEVESQTQDLNVERFLSGNSRGPPSQMQLLARSGINNSIRRPSVAKWKHVPIMSQGMPQPNDEEDCLDPFLDQGFGHFEESMGRGSPLPNSLVFEEGAWEESGMTTTYDVPGSKTLAPSNSTIKHKIAKVNFHNVIFSHIIIGKLRQVAFLKARLRNASKITLLKGPLGLTLDGSFLGQATFPRCSPGESLSLPLGVDPAINITYLKPTVKRSQSGIFQKEDSNIFTRTIVITNTKRSAPIMMTVLDQVPVSEDERLKIEILNPRGLKAGSDGVRTGQSAFLDVAGGVVDTGNGKGASGSAVLRASVYNTQSGKEVGGNGNWGSAVATAKKGGEVTWNVKLNPGQGVKLVLDYEATFPGGETVVAV
jgi:hypothetical protein